MDQKQQEALKRKFDQAMEQTRRSLEAVDAHRRNLIDNELTLLYSALDLKNLIDSLVNDQEVLFNCLCDLKAMKDKSEETNGQIAKIEEDLEVRGAQIVEMSSKKEDLDTKVTKLTESFNTVHELRTALSHILKKLLESRNDYKTQLTKANERIEQLLAEKSDQKVRRIKSDVQKITPKRTNAIDSYREESAIEDGSSKSNENLSDPDYSPRSLAAQQIKKLKVTCACKAKCLNKRCVCKKAGSYCIDCDCINCLNIELTTQRIAEKRESSVSL